MVVVVLHVSPKSNPQSSLVGIQILGGLLVQFCQCVPNSPLSGNIGEQIMGLSKVQVEQHIASVKRRFQSEREVSWDVGLHHSVI